jgi:hypothetical protein
MSIGEIISTHQGVAVVVEVLPQTVRVGSQTLAQVVAQPLDGGPSVAPAVAQPFPGGGIPYRSLAGQAATAYVASVVEVVTAQDSFAAIQAGVRAEGAVANRIGGVEFGQTMPPTAFSAATWAYYTTQTRSSQPKPTIRMFG